MLRPTLARWSCLALVCTTACAPAIAEQVARGEWYEACRRDKNFDSLAEFDRAVLRELAAGVVLDLEVLDSPALARELGVPVEGELSERVQVVRFSGRLSTPRLNDARVDLVAIGDDKRSFATRWGRVHNVSGTEEESFYINYSGDALSDLGIAELLLAPTGKPGYPDAMTRRPLLDAIPVPSSGGASVGTLRQRAHDRVVQATASERREWREARAAAMRQDPALGPAATRLAERLASGEWLLLRPAWGHPADVMEVVIDGDIGDDHGGQCPVRITVAIALAGPLPLADRVNALFRGGPRPLPELPWRLKEWRGF